MKEEIEKTYKITKGKTVMDTRKITIYLAIWKDSFNIWHIKPEIFFTIENLKEGMSIYNFKDIVIIEAEFNEEEESRLCLSGKYSE